MAGAAEAEEAAAVAELAVVEVVARAVVAEPGETSSEAEAAAQVSFLVCSTVCLKTENNEEKMISRKTHIYLPLSPINILALIHKIWYHREINSLQTENLIK